MIIFQIDAEAMSVLGEEKICCQTVRIKTKRRFVMVLDLPNSVQKGFTQGLQFYPESFTVEARSFRFQDPLSISEFLFANIRNIHQHQYLSRPVEGTVVF